MKNYIALLRGINVGAKRKILMVDLRQLFDELGFIDVTTYIQSGNVLFNTDQTKTNKEIATEIEQAIAAAYDFEVSVIIRTANEINKLITENPFAIPDEIEVNKHHLTLLKEAPGAEALEKIQSYDFAPDQYIIKNKDVFVYHQGRYSDTKLGNAFFEKKLKVVATTRSMKTILKLADLAN